MENSFLPASILALRNYSWSKFFGDLAAGLTVGLVALPLAMAFAIASGVKPEAGLYCAVIAGFLISALGGSTTQIGGPTGAFVVVVSGILAKYGIDGLFMSTMMAGIFLMLLGITKLGSAVKYFPRPVVIGFTNGIAVLIASTQIKDFFGLRLSTVPSEFAPRMLALVEAAQTVSPVAATFAAVTVITVFGLSRVSKRIPGAVVALLLGTAVAVTIGSPIETIGSKFGGIRAGFPALHVPQFRPDLVTPLLGAAFTVAMLGAIESLLSAVVADRATGDRHNPNVELFAQGVANLMSPLFGGLPATGAIARTATNIRSGATTPVAGMVHALVLLIILLVAAPLARHIPLAILAGILIVVAYNMGEWKEIPDILRQGKADPAVWLITFGLTVFADLTIAVEAGMILAALVYIRRVTSTTTLARVTPEHIAADAVHSIHSQPIPSEVAVYRIHGPFLFGASEKLDEIYRDLPNLPPVVVLRLRNMNAIDATGLHAIERLADAVRATGRHLILCGLREQPQRLIDGAEFARHLGASNLVSDFTAALSRARELLTADSRLAQNPPVR